MGEGHARQRGPQGEAPGWEGMSRQEGRPVRLEGSERQGAWQEMRRERWAALCGPFGPRRGFRILLSASPSGGSASADSTNCGSKTSPCHHHQKKKNSRKLIPKPEDKYLHSVYAVLGILSNPEMI